MMVIRQQLVRSKWVRRIRAVTTVVTTTKAIMLVATKETIPITKDAWYPASGMRVYWDDYSDDEYEYLLVGGFGSYWSVLDDGILYCDGYADGGSWDGFYDGHSVRCQKE